MKKVLSIMVLAVIMTLSLTACSSGSAKKKFINLNDYMNYELDGRDGHGEVEYSFDYKGLINDNETLTGLKKRDLKPLIGGHWSQRNGLENGDEITYTWDVNLEKIEEEYDVVFIYNDIEIEVSGLPEHGGSSNTFDDITIVW